MVYHNQVGLKQTFFGKVYHGNNNVTESLYKLVVIFDWVNSGLGLL